MRVSIFSFFLLLPILFFGQNLVPNPSFEDYYICPPGTGGLAIQGGDVLIMDWYSMSWTPDYMHYCAGQGATNYPPNNVWGYQEPFHGDAYLSFVSRTTLIDTREYFAVELFDLMVIGQTYSISFNASDADGGINEYRDCATNNIGALLLKDPPYYWDDPNYNNILNPGNFAHVNFDQILTDSTGWTLISADIIADDSYTHIAIGNFFDDENTLFEMTDEDAGCEAMYYIDQVCIVKEGEDCDIVHSIEDSSSIESIPTFQIVNGKIEIKGSSINFFEIFDSQGKRLYCTKNIKNNNYDISDLSSGMYIVQILYSENKTINSKIFIN